MGLRGDFLQDSSHSGTRLLNKTADGSMGPVTQNEQTQMTPLVVHTRTRSSGALVQSLESTNASGLYEGSDKPSYTNLKITESLDQGVQHSHTQNLSFTLETAHPNDAQVKNDTNMASLLEDAGKVGSAVPHHGGAFSQMTDDTNTSGEAICAVTRSSGAVDQAAGAYAPRLSSTTTKPECTVIDIGWVVHDLSILVSVYECIRGAVEFAISRFNYF